MFGFYAVGLRLCMKNRNFQRNIWLATTTLEFSKKCRLGQNGNMDLLHTVEVTNSLSDLVVLPEYHVSISSQQNHSLLPLIQSMELCLPTTERVVFLINISAIQFRNIEELIEKHGLPEILVRTDSHWVSQQKLFNGSTLVHQFTSFRMSWVHMCKYSVGTCR